MIFSIPHRLYTERRDCCAVKENGKVILYRHRPCQLRRCLTRNDGHWPLAVADALGTRTFAYDADTLQLISETLPDGAILSRTTDAFGRPAGISVAGIGDPGSPDYAVTYGYDSAGRFGSVTTLAPLAALAVQYDYVQGSDLLAGWSSNVGMSFHRTFEPNRDLIASVTNAWNGAAVSSFAYTNDELGRRTARVDSGLTQNSFGYNMRSELVNAIMGTNNYGYEFDPIGNRIASTNNAITVSYAANLLNQYTNVVSAVSITPTYDDDGNMTAYGDWGFAWNGENRLITATNATEAVSYTYDHQGRMVEKTTDSATTRYLWDGFNIIAEIGANETRYNIWGLDLSQTQQGAGGVGGLLAVAVAGGADPGIFYPAYDANGNITEYVDATGDVVATRAYSPFGETTAATGNADAFSHWWSTKPWDPVTGFSEYEFRMYHPELGRWVNRDPIEERGGFNLYAFALNCPLNILDILGLANYRIGSPTEPPMTFDEGFVYDPNVHATAEDYLSWTWWNTKGLGAMLLRPDLVDAVAAYHRYLDGTGTDMEVNYPKAYRDDTNVRTGVNNEIAAAQADAERLVATGGARFMMTGDATRLGTPSTENWQKTIGQHYIWGHANVEACADKFTMTITIHAKDRYNFNRGANDIATGWPDSANGRFAVLGWAKSFITKGKIMKKVTWKKGEMGPTTMIDDPPPR